MEPTEQRDVFAKLVSRARRADILKFNQDGVAVLVLPPTITVPATVMPPLPTISAPSAPVPPPAPLT